VLYVTEVRAGTFEAEKNSAFDFDFFRKAVRQSKHSLASTGERGSALFFAQHPDAVVSSSRGADQRALPCGSRMLIVDRREIRLSTQPGLSRLIFLLPVTLETTSKDDVNPCGLPV